MQIAVSHGGTVTAQSRVGQGSTFQVRLPRVAPPADPGRVPAALAAGAYTAAGQGANLGQGHGGR